MTNGHNQPANHTIKPVQVGEIKLHENSHIDNVIYDPRELSDCCTINYMIDEYLPQPANYNSHEGTLILVM